MSPLKSLIEKTRKEFDAKYGNAVLIISWAMEECECDQPKCICSEKIKSFLSQSQTEAYNAGLRAAVEAFPQIIKPFEMDTVPSVSQAALHGFDRGFNKAINLSKSSIESLISK